MSQGEHSARDDEAGTPSPPAIYVPGSVVAGHRLVRMIGAGGVGVVYEAVHEFTQRRVALKLLLPCYASTEQVRERARKEAIALCRLRHKNIVAVHSADMLPDGTVWIAMELLEGQPLRRICQVESPLPIARALHVGIEIADGLAAAHDLGIVHRDVKPENVFVDRHGEVKLLDLNIAKIRVDGLPSTRPGQRFGTTAYMAPEECWGEPCSPASDVYALSLVIYELLAGRYVFATGRGLSGMPSEGQLVAAHMLRMPVPVHEIVPSIPDYVWSVLQTGLSKRPAQRFRHAGAAASALRELRERYLSDVRAGRLAAAPDPGTPGARREHHGPRSPVRLIAAPQPDESRVIVPGPAASAELGGSEAHEEDAAPAAREEDAVPAAWAAQPSAPPSPPPSSAPPAADPGWPLLVTPGPVTVRSSPGGGTSLLGPDLPATDRVADRRWRAQLLRRCAAAAVLAIPISGAATALYIHMRRERPAMSASESGAASAAPAGEVVTSAQAAPARPDIPHATRVTRETGAPPDARVPESAAEPLGIEASEAAPSPPAESRGIAARPSAPAKASTPAQPSAPATRARPAAGAARAPARRPWDWLKTSKGRDEKKDTHPSEEEDIYPMPSRGRAPAPARPAPPRERRHEELPFGDKPEF
ncbi:protein kinase [Sorangium sp. So ce302]|uniref:serine/threonine-protein kinase n=1 Tax=Sorangium sp. So ce302 TaxID=3133297 RepID=UPI003F609F6F